MAPSIILIFSGKRKCGKDYLTDHLQKLLGDQCTVIKISEPIKSHWAKEKKLSLEELMGDGPFKEKYRREMIEWSDEMRSRDSGCFCRTAVENAAPRKIWIVSDVRRKTDICWFEESFKGIVRTVRVTADPETRNERGFKFVSGVDDVTSECDLDGYDNWDLVIDNGRNREPLETQLGHILAFIQHL